MVNGVDGTVKIDTSIDTKGFSAGMQKLANSAQGALNGVLKPLVHTGYAVKETFSKIGSVIGKTFEFLKKALLGVLFVLALSLGSLFSGLKQEIADMLKLAGPQVTAQVDAIKNKWEEVKASIALAFLPLITAALPYIMMIEDWLIKVFNTVAQIVAAFLGQKQVMQVIPGSAAKLAKATEQTKKNAQGALAAFDQINVLAKQQSSGSAATSDPAKVATQMVPVTDDILAKVQAIKDIIAQWWSDPIGMIKKTWGAIVEWFKTNVINPLVAWWNQTWLGQMLGKLWDSFKDTWSKLVANAKQNFENIKTHIIQAFTGVKEFLFGVFTGDWALAWQGLKDIVAGVFGAIWDIIQGQISQWLILFQWFKTQVAPIISAVWDWVKTKAADAWNSIKSVWQSVVAWFNATVLTPLQNAFTGVFGGIKNYVMGVLNSIIATITTMINTIINGFNNLLGLFSQPQIPTVPTAPIGSAGGGTSSGGSLGSAGGGSIPRLATGAVIPPNQQFAAILGDQSSGTNIEAPADLIRQIVREEMQNSNAEATIPITLTLDGETIYRNQKRVSLRHGTSLKSSGNNDR